MTQVLTGQNSLLTFTVYADGTPADQGPATLNLVDLAGAETAVPATNVGDGVYTAEVGPFDTVGFYRAVLETPDATFDQGHVEVVGNFLFTEAQARAFQDGRIEAEAKFSDAEIAAERIGITDWLESVTGASWVPRYRRATLRGNGRHEISLIDAFRTEGPSGGEGATSDIQRIISINGEPVDDTDVDISRWRICWDSGTFTGRTVIEYEYGHRHLRSGVDRIALLELVTRLPASRLPQTAVAATDDFGTYNWEPQNSGRPSRVPEVNAWARANDRRVPIG